MSLNVMKSIKSGFLTMILFALAISNNVETVDNTFLFCLKHEQQPLEIFRSGSGFSVDNAALNSFFDTYQIINIEPWIPGATELDKDGDIYLNRIYRVYLAENSRSNMIAAKEDITQFTFIHSSEFEMIRKPVYQPNDPNYDQQCSLPAVKADLAWDFWDIASGLMPGDRHVLLAAVDTGVDITHPDLQHNIWINQNEIPSSLFSTVDSDNDNYVTATEVLNYLTSNNMDTNNDGAINLRDALTSSSQFTDNQDNDGDGFTDDIVGWDHSGYSGADDNDPYPRENVQADGTWAHGTHVSGILGVTTDNNLGIASTAFNASVIAVKCSRENQPTEPYVNDGYAGITYAAKAGFYAGTFTIINCSWGGGGYNSYEQTTINNAHNTWGAVIVAAAGNGSNSGGEENSAHYPSSYTNVISVCALGCSGSWGHWATYHNTVDIGGPGEGILSTIIGTGYASWDGSSMASPNVASCIGLLQSYYPDWDNVLLEETIIATADPFIYEINDEEYLQGNLGSGMVDVHKAIGAINFPYLYYYSHSLLNIAGDGDGVLNPGESSQLRVTIGNVEGWTNATEVTAILTTTNPAVTITDANADYGTIYAGGIQINISDTYSFELAEDIDLGEVNFIIEVSTLSAQGEQVAQNVPFSIEVSLNQEGWPIHFLSEALYNVETSPVVIDTDANGQNEIYFSDYSGNVYAVNPDGSEVISAIFPYNTGNQVWGSPAAADIDGDGHDEIIVSSKSKHLFIFDPVDQIVQADYNSLQFLMGTPAIGNIDDDEDLEIIIGGFSSPGKIFAINPDGTDVPGFPFELGEKMMRGVALADFNDNGKVDIVCGTESNKLWVVYDDGTIAPGFPFIANEKFRAAPVVINAIFGKVILAGCRDNTFYAINQDGSLRFSIPTSDYVLTSPAIYKFEETYHIFFASNDGGLYGVDLDGNTLSGWPVFNNGAIVTSPVIADLDNDGSPEIISGTQMGDMVAFNLDGSPFIYFPISNIFGYSGSPTVTDTDMDGDLEILLGSTGNMVNIDLKFEGNVSQYWNVHRGNYLRTGYFDPATGVDCSSCTLGDVNCDGTINVLDVVRTVYIIINSPNDLGECEFFLADINEDTVLDVLDLVIMIDLIINPE